jgi:hypothetical protein
MSTFFLMVLGRFFGGFGFWWSDELSNRFTDAAEAQTADSSIGAVLVVYARSAEPQEDPGPTAHEKIWTDDDNRISNGF